MPTDFSSPFEPLDTVYRIACLLAGPEEAPALVRHTYQRAADEPLLEWPDDVQEWLLHQMATTHGASTQDEPLVSSDPSPSSPPSSPHSDPFRDTVAQEILERQLPTAFAACSERDRFVLALDAVGASPKTIATAVGGSEDGLVVRSEARHTLTLALHETLTDAERAIVRPRALDSEGLRPLLRKLLIDRYPSPPASLRSHVQTIIRGAQRERQASSSEGTKTSSGMFSTFRKLVAPRWLGTAAVAVLLAAGTAYGLMHLESSSSPVSLESLTAAAADTIQPTVSITDPSDARTHVGTTWGRRVSVPTFMNASLQAVGRLQTNADLTVPVFIYVDEDPENRILAFAFNYAALDRLDPEIQLGDSLRAALGDETALVTSPARQGSVLLWRQRDDIYVARAPHLSPEGLRDRVQP